MPRDDTTRVPAITRAFQVLGELRDGPRTLSQLSSALDMNKSTCLYTVRTLVDLGAASRSGTPPRYVLGPLLVDLGFAADAARDALTLLRTCIEGVAEPPDATLVVYRRVDLDTVTLVETFERPSQVRITVPIGARLPIQGGSFGRCFLAHDPPDMVDAALASGLCAFTLRSETDEAAFRRDLKEVHDRGWTVDHEGFALGVSTVAAPVRGASGRTELVVAAVGFTSQVTGDVASRWGELLRSVALSVERSLGPTTRPPGGEA